MEKLSKEESFDENDFDFAHFRSAVIESIMTSK